MAATDRSLRFRVTLMSLIALALITPAQAQLCGDADSSGSLAGSDIFKLTDYLFDGDPAPTGPADVDDYALRTVRDIVFLSWNLVEGAPALTCPPSQPALAPALSTAQVLVYDEVFPAGATAVNVRLFLKITDSLAAFSLPLNIRVNGAIPSFSPITFGPAMNPVDVRRSSLNAPQGRILLGAATFARIHTLPPGVHLIASFDLFMNSSGVDRPISITWTQFPPMEGGQNVHYPMLVFNDMSTAVPDLLPSCVAETDGDGVVDCADQCPGFDDRLDADGDLTPDDCDLCAGFDDRLDADGDGVPDGCDLCAGYDDHSDIDADGMVDCFDDCTDSDHDGLGNPGIPYNTCPPDNCPYVANLDQLNSDGDDKGDVCDNCPQMTNADQTDADFDGRGDACDNCPAVYNRTQGDVDNNGVGNACDPGTPQITQVAHLYLDGYGSDCWGYTAPDGSEYAFYGGSASVVTVRAYPNVQVISYMAHSVSQWRCMRTYKNYLYAVTEGNSAPAGLLVADLSPLPAPPVFLGTYPVDGVNERTSHMFSIDTVRGYAYLEGDRGSRSIHIHNLANPAVPVFVRSFGNFSQGIHDLHAYNNRLYVAEGSTSSWSIWDVTNKSNPVMQVRITVPGHGYLHNIWPTADAKYCVTTEETPDRTIKFWDISDLGNVQLKGEYLAPSNLAHNAHVQGNTVYFSHYESGVAVVNIADRSQPREFALFDTYPWGEGPFFSGCWGIYPHTHKNLIYASNIEGDLYILRFDPSLQCPISETGDLNGNHSVSVTDIIELANYVFKAGATPSPCVAAADVNCSGLVTSADIIYLVGYVFKGGPPPCNVCSLIPSTWSCP